MNKTSLSLAALVTFLITPMIALAHDAAHVENVKGVVKIYCADLIKECFASVGELRANCFHSSAKSAACENTPLGKLSLKRWALSPSLPSGQEAPPAFLGPQFVDRSCITNFDNEWSSSMVGGTLSAAAIATLDAKLTSCIQEPPADLLRP